MIDKKYQAQGLGKQTIDAVMALIRTSPFGEAKKVWLSYEPENIRATTKSDKPNNWWIIEGKNEGFNS